MSPEAPAILSTGGFRPAALSPTASPADGAQARSRGYAAGYASGYAAGSRAATRDAEQQRQELAEQHARAEATRDAVVGKALSLLEAAVAAVRGTTVPVLEDARTTLDQAAVALAEAVLGHELADTDGSVPGSARHTLERVLATPVDLGVHTVRLHPTDHAHVSRVLADPTAGTSLPAGVELAADPSLTPGDVVSEYPDGWLDGRIGSALDRARRALAEGSS